MNKVRTNVATESIVRDELNRVYDVVVIGGGAAGLSGALTLGRSRRSVLVVDAGEPRNAPAAHMHNYLGSEGVAPGDLLARGRAEVAQYGVRVVGGTVSAVRQLTAAQAETGGGRFTIDLADGRVVRARRLLVATGLVDELPAVPGVVERWGRDVLHCPFCHGWEVRDQAIGILGTGPMAAHQAAMFRQLSMDVVLFQHTAPPLTDEQAEQLAARGITVVAGEVAALDVEDDRLTGVRLRSGDFVPRQAVVVAPRFTARAEVLTSLGLETNDLEIAGQVVGRYVPADAQGATSVSGVYVVGNVTDLMGQVITAAAAGLRTGGAIHADLIADDTARAVEEFRARTQGTAEPITSQT